MKRQFSLLSVLVLTLGALASQSCESTGSQNTYYNRGHYGYYPDGRYALNNGYYPNGQYAPNNGYYPNGVYVPNGYYGQGHYVGDGYQTNRPTVDLHF
jgi:hypothetical protein